MPGSNLSVLLVDAWEGLQEARTAVEFHHHLAVLISNAKLLPDEWLDEIARIASIPWSKGKGNPGKASEIEELEWLYFHRHLGGVKSPLLDHDDAVKDIQRLYAARGIAVEFDAARQKYYKAKKLYRSRPYAVAVISEQEEN
jgi:hypothetical protein